MGALKLPEGLEPWAARAAYLAPTALRSVDSTHPLTLLHERLTQGMEEPPLPRRRWGVGRGWSAVLLAALAWVPLAGVTWLLWSWLG